MLRTRSRFFISAALLMLVVAVSTTAAPARQVDSLRVPRALTFERNSGQTDGSVSFIARGAGYTLYLADSTAVMAIEGRGGASDHAIRVQFAGSNGTVPVCGVDELPIKSHYLTGSRPSDWRRNVRHFRAARYEELYDGIDLIFSGNEEKAEYDFVVSPGANPDQIALAFDGVDGAEIDGAGDLVLRIPAGVMKQKRPVAYQIRGEKRESVRAAYQIVGQGRVRFALGAYDTALPLVIDPVIAYSTYLGGTGQDVSQSIAVDAAGNAYITGWTRSLDFPTTAGAYDRTGDIHEDAFVTRLAPDGALVYSTFLGGTSRELGRAIDIDAAGNVYTAGQTSSADFPIVNGFQAGYVQINAADDAYVVKLSPDGSTILYSTFLGGLQPELPWAIVTDGNGAAYVTGFTGSTDFPTTPGAYQQTFGGGFQAFDVFVSKINTNATGAVSLVYSTFIGGTDTDFAEGIDVDAAGNAVITGVARSETFPRTVGPSFTGQSASFLTKLNAAGSDLIFSRLYAGGSDVVLDPAGNAYVSTGGPATFIKVDPTGTTVTPGPNSALVLPSSIDLDPAGNIYVAGQVIESHQGQAATRLKTVDPFQAAFGGGETDAAVAKYSPLLVPIYVSYLGGSGDDAFQPRYAAVAADASGNAYVTAATVSADFPTTSGALDRTFNGIPGCSSFTLACVDAFVTKVTAGAIVQPVTIALTPATTTVTAGASTPLTVTISSPRATPTTVTLTSSGAAATVPETVEIPAGESSVTFQLTGVSAGAATIRATLPATLGGGTATSDVTVTTPANPMPAITAINPSSTRVGGGAISVTVAGTGFVAGTVVHINGSPRQTTFISATELRVALLAADIATPGTASITAVSPAPGGGTSNAVTFAINAVLEAIPTLSFWMLLLCAALIALVAIIPLRTT